MKTYCKICFAVTLLSLLIGSGCTTSSEYLTFEDQVKETVSNMINLLEQGNYYDLVRDYADPEFVKEEGGVKEVLKEKIEYYIIGRINNNKDELKVLSHNSPIPVDTYGYDHFLQG